MEERSMIRQRKKEKNSNDCAPIHSNNLPKTKHTTYIFTVLLKFALNRGIPVILNVIVTASRQLLGNVGPPVPVVLVHGNQNGFFVIGPLSLL